MTANSSTYDPYERKGAHGVLQIRREANELDVFFIRDEPRELRKDISWLIAQQ